MVTKLWLALVAQVPTCIFKLGDFQAVVITATNPYYILYRNFNVLNKRKRCFIRKYETSAFFSFDNNTKTDFQVLIYKRMISIFNSFCADKYFFVLIVKQVFLTKQKRKKMWYETDLYKLETSQKTFLNQSNAILFNVILIIVTGREISSKKRSFSIRNTMNNKLTVTRKITCSFVRWSPQTFKKVNEDELT